MTMPTTLHASDVSAEELQRIGDFVSSLPKQSPTAVLFQQFVTALRRGIDISVFESDKELTPQQAADLLNVSRPHLLKVMDRGLLDYRLVGTNRRIAMADLVDYVARHERGNAYVNSLLDTREVHRHHVRDAAATLTDSDLAALDALAES